MGTVYLFQVTTVQVGRASKAAGIVAVAFEHMAIGIDQDIGGSQMIGKRVGERGMARLIVGQDSEALSLGEQIEAVFPQRIGGF